MALAAIPRSDPVLPGPRPRTPPLHLVGLRPLEECGWRLKFNLGINLCVGVFLLRVEIPALINASEWPAAAATAAKSLQSCPTLCDPIDGSPPGSPIPGTLQARTLEWVAISFSNA